MAKKLTDEEFVERVHCLHPEFKIKSVYKNVRSPITVECGIGHEWTTPRAINLLEGKGCPECWKKKWVDTVACNNKHYSKDSIKNIRPDLADYVKYSEDANKYSYGTSAKIEWHCPYCNTDFIHSVSDFNRRGFRCPRCKTSGHFPNRYMYSILKESNLDFISEYSPKWANSYRYDFYLPKYKTIIEMDGSFHFTDNNMNGTTLEMQQNTDEIKDKIAKENGLDVIRIDCNYKDTSERFDYINKNLLLSNLTKIIDFNSIDLTSCCKKCLTPLYHTICLEWSKNIYSVRDLAKKFKTNKNSIIQYLKFGNELGICFYNAQEQKTIGTQKISIPLFCIESNKYYKSISEAERDIDLRIKKLDKNNYISTKDINGNIYHFYKITIEEYK